MQLSVKYKGNNMDKMIMDFLSSSNLFLVLLIGLAALYFLGKGADYVVDEAVDISLSWGIPKVIVGSTLVSLGTTLPETSVSVAAAINGNPGIALGNAIGSIIANTALIMGIVIIFGKVSLKDKSMKLQSNLMLVFITLLAVATVPFFDFSKEGNVSQIAGFSFVTLLVCYIVFSIRNAKKNKKGEDVSNKQESIKFSKFIRLFSGILIVIISSKVLIPSVQILALRIGIPESVLGATLVALGTSLPELITAIVAVKKKQTELALGNIIGANILNVLFVVGSSASVTPQGLAVPFSFYQIQIPFMFFTVILFKFSMKNSDISIRKKYGCFLLVLYLLYLILSFIIK